MHPPATQLQSLTKLGTQMQSLECEASDHMGVHSEVMDWVVEVVFALPETIILRKRKKICQKIALGGHHPSDVVCPSSTPYSKHFVLARDYPDPAFFKMLYSYDEKLIQTQQQEWHERAKTMSRLMGESDRLTDEIAVKTEEKKELIAAIDGANGRMKVLAEDFRKAVSMEEKAIDADMLESLSKEVARLRASDPVNAAKDADEDLAEAWSLVFATKQEKEDRLNQVDRQLKFMKRATRRVA